MKEGQHVWLVKYALTNGISEEVVVSSASVEACVRIEGKHWNFYKVGRDVFEDHAEAVEAAETLRKKKLDSLRKQIAKLEKLKF